MDFHQYVLMQASKLKGSVFVLVSHSYLVDMLVSDMPIENMYYEIGIRSRHWTRKQPIGCLLKSCVQIRRKDNILFYVTFYIALSTCLLHAGISWQMWKTQTAMNCVLLRNVWDGTWGHGHCQLSLGHAAMSFYSSGCPSARYRNSCWPQSVHWHHY